MLNYREYSDKALVTIKPHASKELALADWTMGLAGEAGEVMEVSQHAVMELMDFAKEVGDVLWYGAALLNELGVTAAPDGFSKYSMQNLGYSHLHKMLMTPASVSTNVCIDVSKIVEAMKHYIMHHEDTPIRALAESIYRLNSHLAVLCQSVNIDITDVAELNLAKLQHRYEKNRGLYSENSSADRHYAEACFEDTPIYVELRRKICEDSRKTSF